MLARRVIDKRTPTVALLTFLVGLTAIPGAQAGTTPKAFPTISAGDTHTCAIKANAVAACWGNDGARQATVAATLGPVRAVSAGLNHSCFVTGAPGDARAQVKVVCFGDNTQKQATVPGDLLSVIKVSAGWNHNCAIKAKSTDASGVARCWGANEFGQSTSFPVDIGKSIDGSGNVLNSAGAIIDPAGKLIDISAGGSHSCAVKVNGTVRCWGSNIYGQKSVPAGLTGVVQVAAGFDFTCALKSDQSVVCWGGNSAARSAVADPITVPDDLADPATAYGAQLSAGAFHVCLVQGDGKVRCWGAPPNHPQTPPATLLPAATVTAGKSVSWPHTCTVSTNGTLNCWGDDAYGDVSGFNSSDFLSLVTLTASIGVPGTTIDFGSVTAGTSSPNKSLTLTNTTPTWITTVGWLLNPNDPNSVVISSPNPATNPFGLVSNGCAGPVTSSVSCSIDMSLKPRAWQRGPFTGTLTVNDMASGSPRAYSLAGTATAPPSFVLNSASAQVTPLAVTLGWDTSEVSTVTITATQDIPGAKPNVLATLKKQPAATLKFVWNRKIGKAAAAKGNWIISIAGTASNGTATAPVPVTLT